MVRITVDLDDDLALGLRHLAEIEGRSQAELIRDALKTFTGQKVRPMPTGIGELHSGHSDTSVRAKEILREASKRGKWRAGLRIRARFTDSTAPTPNLIPVT